MTKKTQETYVQYHNSDNLESFPTENISFLTPIREIELDNIVKFDNWIYTRKKSVLKAKGNRCFLIVGKTENKIKKYYLWASFIIEDYKYEFEDYIDVIGTGNDFKKPILLNELSGFSEFKNFCGNFGLGFQNVTNSHFSIVLNSFITSDLSKLEVSSTDYIQKLSEINKNMIEISPEKREIEINRLIRKDSKIVELCKKVYEYKCQYPNCCSEIPSKNGINYVEVAHIKPVKEGGQSILGNLVVLCPNHHKEFDLGFLQIIEQNEKELIGILNNKEFKITFK